MATETFDADFVIACFEDASATLCSLPRNAYAGQPDEFQNDFIREFVEASGRPAKAAQKTGPLARKIAAMEAIFQWLEIIPAREKSLRRIVALRSVTGPTGKPKSWRSIGQMIGAKHGAVKYWHTGAIARIVAELNHRAGAAAPAAAE